jgi:hypothetical protein
MKLIPFHHSVAVTRHNPVYLTSIPVSEKVNAAKLLLALLLSCRALHCILHRVAWRRDLINPGF